MTLNKIIQTAANWLLELQEIMNEMERAIGIKFTTEAITDFQSRVAKPFFILVKENIQNRFNSQNVVLSSKAPLLLEAYQSLHLSHNIHVVDVFAPDAELRRVQPKLC